MAVRQLGQCHFSMDREGRFRLDLKWDINSLYTIFAILLISIPVNVVTTSSYSPDSTQDL